MNIFTVASDCMDIHSHKKNNNRGKSDAYTNHYAKTIKLPSRDGALLGGTDHRADHNNSDRSDRLHMQLSDVSMPKEQVAYRWLWVPGTRPKDGEGKLPMAVIFGRRTEPAGVG